MIWGPIGNKWYDNFTRRVMDLNIELYSYACDASPLDEKDKEDLRKAFEKINKVNVRVVKREEKKRKKKS